MQARSGYTAAFALTVVLFALWGLGHQLYDTLLPKFAGVFGLRGFSLALTQSIYSLVYFLGAIPAAMFARRLGYKAAITFGLGCLGLGAFVLYPAAEAHVLSYLMIAVVVISLGWVLLEIGANPLMACLGPVESSVRRLNTAQALFPLGALAGVFIGRWIVASHLALPAAQFTWSIAHPYILIGAGVLLLAYVIEETRFPAIATERQRGSLHNEFAALVWKPLFRFAFVAQFCAVLALAGTWSQAGHSLGGNLFVWCLGAFAAGRAAGSALMFWLEPEPALILFAAGGLVSALAGVVAGGAVPLIASSFCVSILWPTILGLAIRGQGGLMKLGTALICMGGALGGVAYDMIGTMLARGRIVMLIPALCYVAVLGYGLAADRARREIGTSGAVLSA